MAQQTAETVYDRIEAAAGIDVNEGLEAMRKMQKMLRDKRREITDLKRANVALEAKYGNKGNGAGFAMWEHRRKIVLAELETSHADHAQRPGPDGSAGGKKPSDETLKRLAHADPKYASFYDQALAERAQYLAYSTQVDDLYNEVEYIQGGIDRIRIRLRMDEEAVRYTRGEMNLSK